MSFRRFLYLVTDDTKSDTFLLRRLDMSRFFLPKGARDGLAVAPPLVDGHLPPPVQRFTPPSSKFSGMDFMLLAGGEGRKEKVVALDQTGRCLLYDPYLLSVRSLPALSEPKIMPASVTVGGNLYIIDTVFGQAYSRDLCFDALIHDRDGSSFHGQDEESEDDCHCQSLPPPPYAHGYYHPRGDPDPAHITSYAIVGDHHGSTSIWVSKNSLGTGSAGLGTHSFDVKSGVWTKAGSWELPFWGHAQYEPEHKLWFGLLYSFEEDSDCILCASDLTMSPPTRPRILWRHDPLPQECIQKSSYLVHLGCSRFCVARFFKMKQPEKGAPCLRYVVLTGLELEDVGSRELRVIKHRSERYKLVDKLMHWVL